MMTSESEEYSIYAFYKFAQLPDDYADLREPALELCQANNVTGLLLISAEGVNGTVSGTRKDIELLLAFLVDKQPLLKGVKYKVSFAQKPPFYSMRIRLKQEIVTMGIAQDECDPSKLVGKYVAAAEWNNVLEDPDVLVIDARNDYETKLGTFKGAKVVDPNLTCMNEFPEYVKNNLDPSIHSKVAMFCTGGIRCEKASSYMLRQGFKEILHLEGGILQYLESIPQEESKFEGECYVFDERLTVDHTLRPGKTAVSQCYGCRRPLTKEDLSSDDYEEFVQCGKCAAGLDSKKKSRRRQRAIQMELATQRGTSHTKRQQIESSIPSHDSAQQDK
ncbi:hypothetical protein CYMTET_32153 [Cymbomonas tetramitiformis]|uniref:Rhodanese domain-containing protein n=1 Tax=Cymbomonas tetramitiformis TaxID=36881 RepID=A0AAE0FFP0_9CHLO|nr:hypothetical protein CYMTET_32153 [Cymbomonas tetramitiformis]